MQRRFGKPGMTLLTLALVLTLAVAAPAADDKVLTMATTTSTDNTGLLDELAPQFQKATGIELRWTATGTGKALKLGENCDVDILMVHAPAAEQRFVDSGFGLARHEIMYNDFVIVRCPAPWPRRRHASTLRSRKPWGRWS